MKLKRLFPFGIIIIALYLAATTIMSESSGLRAIGFIVGVICGASMFMWLDDNT